ncbi:MAG: BACON domain-containing protein, partial [Burkholderiales bacterium]
MRLAPRIVTGRSFPAFTCGTVGNGTVNYSVAANTASTARSATLTVGSATFTVTQNGSCAFTVTPTSQGFN